MADLDVTVDANLTSMTAPVAADRLFIVRNSDNALMDIIPEQLAKVVYPNLADGTMLNGKLSVTVSSNDLIVSIKTYAGSDPASGDAVLVKINGTWRSITAATSITIVDGTNWFASGSASLGTQLVGYFSYLVWDSNSSIVALSIARIPYGRLVSDFSATTTNEKHLYNYANFTATDDVANIGYFEATLSLAGTSHLWTVPAFTNLNLKQEPTFETRMLSFTPTWTNLTVGNGTLTGKYQLVMNRLSVRSGIVLGSTSSVSTTPILAMPFALTTLGPTYEHIGGAIFRDTGTALHHGGVVLLGGSVYPQALGAGGTYLTSVDLSSTIPMTWASTDELMMRVDGTIV